MPIAVAGRGPRVQRLAAEQADWVILSAEPLATLTVTAQRLRAHGARLAWSAYLAYDGEQRRKVLGHFSYMALDAPPEIRTAAGLDDERVAAVREAMLAGHLDAAAELLPDSLVDHYAVAGDPAECTARIAALAASVDLFLLPMNDVAGAAAHIVRSAAILRVALARNMRSPATQAASGRSFASAQSLASVRCSRDAASGIAAYAGKSGSTIVSMPRPLATRLT